jgi:uncharacterized protein (DUF697 family)
MTTHLTKPEQEALVTVALMAAFADGGKSDVERAEVKRITESLDGGDLNTSTLYQRVLLRQATLAGAVAPLTAPGTRQLAYEMAVCVCEADDALNEAEERFLAELQRELKLDDQTTAAFQQQADALIKAPLAMPATAVAAPPPQQAAGATDAEVDRMVLNYSILNGALELLPESLATMAIVPLQMKMVYRVGKLHGYDLDRRHITELIGAAGVGLTSQVVEGFARKLLGGLLGKVAGGLGRRAGNQLASSAMSFASTYALGQMAQRYYAGGRQLSALQLKELFTSLTQQARSLHGRYAGEIQQRASTLNPAQLLNLVRGQPSGDPVL